MARGSCDSGGSSSTASVPSTSASTPLTLIAAIRSSQPWTKGVGASARGLVLALLALVGAEIDYKDDLEGAQFVIKNPTATSTCGCGSSFSA